MFDQSCLSFHPARMPLCPTKGGPSVRFATLDQIFFEDVNTHNRHIYGKVLCITGDIARGGKALPLFQRHRKAGVIARECHPPSESCLRKGRLPTRCLGASSQVEPGCDAEGGLLTSTTSLVAGDGGWLPRMALTRSSCVRQPTYGIGRGRAPDTAHVAVGSIAPLWPHPKTVGFASIAPGAIRRTAFRAFRGQAAPCRFCVDLG